MQPVIADASPLIVLARVDLLWLLRELFDHVLVPPAVHAELEIARRRPGYRALEQSFSENWLLPAMVEASQGASLSGLPTGAGEREAILLAILRPCRFLLIDDRGGRLAAKKLGLPVVGTAGVLLLAKERGLISSVAQMLDRLASEGFRLAPSLKHELLAQARELPE